MRIKIVSNPVVCGGSLAANQYRKVLQGLRNRWIKVETDYIFANQYNTVPCKGSENGLRVFAENVAKIDYEKDALLERVHKAMQSGAVRCHHYEHPTKKFIDLYSIRPEALLMS